MTQHTDVLLSSTGYTRSDYTALRAYCVKIPLSIIAERYYSEDSPEREMGLEKFLSAMRRDLIERSMINNPHLAASLQAARQGGAISQCALDVLIEAADAPKAVPRPEQRIAMWFRKRTAAALQFEKIRTLGDLSELIKKRGAGWWRGVPRIGIGRAAKIVAWFNAHATTLGPLDIGRFADAPGPVKILITPGTVTRLAPLEQIRSHCWLDGSQGTNRPIKPNWIKARNDFDAVHFYLCRFADRPHTFTSYTKELERFLYWCILEAKTALSSIDVDACERYKLFLKAPTPQFTGLRAARSSPRWRPFALEPLSPVSQRHAVTVVRTAFQYLVDVGYLGGNPWAAVMDPPVVEAVHDMQIDKALPEALWIDVIARLSLRCGVASHAQDRIALVLLLLLGDSGLRREEAAGALRSRLRPSNWDGDVYELTVLGKRLKERIVPVSRRTVDAIRLHWSDRALDFDDASAPFPLLAPLVIPGHEAARLRHATPNKAGYNSAALYRLFQSCLKRLQEDKSAPTGFTSEQVNALASASPHALRHTFGTLAVADGMPLDVAQAILGHRSPATTAIYVQAKTRRMVEEGAKYFDNKAKQRPA